MKKLPHCLPADLPLLSQDQSSSGHTRVFNDSFHITLAQMENTVLLSKTNHVTVGVMEGVSFLIMHYGNKKQYSK